jgi:hypothetical protein
VTRQDEQNESLSERPSSRSAIKTSVLVAATTTVAFGLFLVLLNTISGFEFFQHYSTLVTTAFGAAALGAYMALDRGAWRWPMIATFGTSVLGVAVGLFDMVSGEHFLCRPPLFSLSYILFPTVIISAWLGLLSLAKLTGGQGCLRLTTQLCVLLLISLPVATFWLDTTGRLELKAAIALSFSGVALGSLAIIGTIAVATLGLSGRRKKARRGVPPG